MNIDWTPAAKARWTALQSAAVEHARDKSTLSASALATAALDFAATQAVALGPKPTAPSAPAGSALVFPPYGRSKGQPVKGASRNDLEFYAAGCKRTLDDPSKERFHAKERLLLAAIEAELGM